MRTRQKPRKTLTLPGRYYTGLGKPVDVRLNDISEEGCRLGQVSTRLPAGSRLQVYVGEAGPFFAMVKWSQDGEVGVTFATPLSADDVREIKNSHVPDVAAEGTQDAFQPMPQQAPQRFC
jgi:hypothetical protein